MDAPGGDVGGHQGIHRAPDERVERPLPLLLAPVAVDGRGPDAALLQLAGDPVGAVLGPAEDDGRAGGRGHLGGHGHPVAGLHLPEQVHGRTGVVLVHFELVAGRIVLVPADQHVDVSVQGGREQQRLAVGRGQVEQPPHVGEEAHVGHAVGLVDDHDLHGIQADAAPLDEVPEPSRTGHGHVHAPGQGLQLGAVAHASVERVDPQVPGRGQGPQLRGHLGRQLAGRGQHQHPRVPGAGRLALQAGHGADPEGQGLARSGRGLAAHVPAGQGVGDGGGLDGERLGDRLAVEGGDDVRGHAEGGEGGLQGGHGGAFVRQE